MGQTQFIDNGDGTGVLTDYEGNTYPTKRWGAKHWTTVNSRSILDKNCQFIDCPDGLRLNTDVMYNVGVLQVQGSIPAGTISDYTNAGNAISGQSYVDFVAEFGLLYNWAQATKVCPDGWKSIFVSDMGYRRIFRGLAPVKDIERNGYLVKYYLFILLNQKKLKK